MDYEGRICRTPGEKSAFKLPVSVGCPYNKCAFCDLFKDLEYRELPLEQIEAELVRVKDVGGAPKRVMLGDGNGFYLPFERLMTVLRMIEEHLPSVELVSSDASIPSIAAKTDEQLAELASHGLRLVYIGIESGLDDVLKFMHKDHNNTQARTQIARLQAHGIDYGAHIMTGIAGTGRGIENARATAAFLNETHPTYVCNFSMGVGPLTELGLMEEDGLFTAASVRECLEEERELLFLLEDPLRFEGFHFTYDRSQVDCATFEGSVPEFNDYVTSWTHTFGNLPHDREKLIAQLDAAIAAAPDDDAGVASITQGPASEGPASQDQASQGSASQGSAA